MKHIVYCIIGASGSGKTTFADELAKKKGLKVLKSYTTRPKRHENDTDHTYINNIEYYKLKGIMASNVINGYLYACTASQLLENDIYVVDWIGYHELCDSLEAKRIENIELRPVYMCTPTLVRVWRMFKRGDSIINVLKRLKSDHDSCLDDDDYGIMHTFITVMDDGWKDVGEKVDEFIERVELKERLALLTKLKKKAHR